jgi:putative toxin-antitoxin system antitoxin component (TIGR02293 family)
MAGGALVAYPRKNEKQGVAEAAADYMAEVPPVQGQHEYVSLLGLRSFDAASLAKRIDEGLSYAAFEKLKRRLDITSRELAEAALINPRTLARRKRTGRFEADESDRLVRLARVLSRAIEFYGGDEVAAQEWIKRPLRALGGISALEMAKTEVGAREVEKLIHQIEHGVVV